MTKSEMGLFDSSFIGPGLLFLNQYFNIVVNEYFVLWVCFVSSVWRQYTITFLQVSYMKFRLYWNLLFSLYACFFYFQFYTTADLLRYSVQVCQQICDYLNIYCFKITPPSKSKGTPGGASNNSHNSHSKSPSHADGSYTRPVTRSHRHVSNN